jgi:hypothetical protein
VILAGVRKPDICPQPGWSFREENKHQKKESNLTNINNINIKNQNCFVQPLCFWTISIV